jgi:hypothetical protein
MAVYLFTFHAYGSWMPDRPQGYVRDGEGVLPSDSKMAEWYRRDAAHKLIHFDASMRPILVDATRYICKTKGWRLHRVQVVSSHLHALVSWREFEDWKNVRNTLKRCLGIELSKALNHSGPWFSRNGSRKRIRDQGHFDYLMAKYLPRHGGAFWQEQTTAM